MDGHLIGKLNPRFISMDGKVCGLLTVLSFSHFDKNLAIWNCACECGSEVKVKGSCLRSGKTKSCGCTRKINAPAAARIASLKHGMYRTPTYYSWQSVLARCDKPSHKSYHYYGGRGIKVCDAWRDFSRFHLDMGTRPAGMTIERLDNSKGYEPGNCEWKTAKDQARNRRSNKYITAFGETKLLVEWVEDQRCVVWRDTLSYRLSKGWTSEKALTTPLMRKVNSIRGTKTDMRRDGCAVWKD